MGLGGGMRDVVAGSNRFDLASSLYAATDVTADNLINSRELGRNTKKTESKFGTIRILVMIIFK